MLSLVLSLSVAAGGFPPSYDPPLGIAPTVRAVDALVLRVWPGTPVRPSEVVRYLLLPDQGQAPGDKYVPDAKGNFQISPRENLRRHKNGVACFWHVAQMEMLRIYATLAPTEAVRTELLHRREAVRVHYQADKCGGPGDDNLRGGGQAWQEWARSADAWEAQATGIAGDASGWHRKMREAAERAVSPAMLCAPAMCVEGALPHPERALMVGALILLAPFLGPKAAVAAAATSPRWAPAVAR